MHPTTESANARASGLAVVASMSEAREYAEAHGRYVATCVGPRDKDKAKYREFRDGIAAIEARGLLYRLANKARLTELQARLADIELVTIWADEAENVVCTVGKNAMLDAALAGSSYSVTGPYIGLVSSASYSAVAAADTMASHAGWLEAGNANAPSYSGGRKTAAWSAASAGAKALSAAASFAMTTTPGTVKGCFMVFGTGAVATVDNTSGVLYSVGLFSGGDQPVVDTNTLNVSYSTSL